MKIRYLEQSEHGRSRALYEEIFVEDEQAFVDAYYQIKAADNLILAAEEDGEIFSMLHRNPYTLSLRGRLYAADYIVAVATRVTHRHQGLMRSLLTKALKDMEREQKPFAFLMPAAEAIYTPFDFRLMGNVDEEGLSRLSGEELSEQYELFVWKDEAYQRRHVPVREWEATPMMVRIVHLPSMVETIGAEAGQRLIISVEDSILPANHGTFCWEFTETESRLYRTEETAELSAGIAELGSFLFGMLGAEELLAVSRSQDKEAVREKLEQIRVLDGIYINEVV